MVMMSAKEASTLWGISTRRVTTLCSAGKIPGASKENGSWQIPANAEKPADAEITYSASWILLKDSDGFSQTVTMLDAPTRVKISKADITTHEEIPGATLRVLDKGGNVVDEWVSEDTPHYMEAVLVAGETYMLEETLVPDNSGYVPANSIQFTVEDDGKVQHVFMQDDYTKVQLSLIHI